MALAWLIAFFAWLLAIELVIDQLMLDDDKQDKKRHTIELIALILIPIGIIGAICLPT